MYGGIVSQHISGSHRHWSMMMVHTVKIFLSVGLSFVS